MSVLRVKNGDQWDIVPAIKGDTGDPAADESITDAMLVPDGIKTEIDWLWGNQLMDIREGELLQTDDAYEGPLVSLDVDGKSTQVVTTGKNLFDNTNTPLGYYNASDGVFVSNSNYRWWSVPVAEGDVVRYTNCPDCIMTYYLDGAFVGHGAQTWTATYNVPDGVDEVRGYCASRSWSTGIVTKNNSDLTYEPYTGGKPTPRPDWPQDILSMNEPNVVIAGKNILDPSFLMRCGWTESNGQYTGTPRQLYQGLTNHIVPVTCAPNTQYVFSWYQISSTETTNGNAADFRFVYSDGTQSASRYTDLNNRFKVVSEAGKTVTGLRFSYVRAPTLVVKCVQLVPLIAWDDSSSIEENYQPYIASTTVPLLPDGYSLRSLPDGTKDELHLSYLRPSTREGWAWYDRELVKRVGTIDLGTLSWSKYYEQDNTFFAIISDIKRRYLGALCTAYKQVQGGVDTLTNGEFSTSSGGNTSIWFRNDSYTVAADFKAAVSGVILDYILATPITEALDPIELPIMPSKDTTIWSDPSTQLKVTYIQDTNLVIQNLEATVADMATS